MRADNQSIKPLQTLRFQSSIARMELENGNGYMIDTPDFLPLREIKHV